MDSFVSIAFLNSTTKFEMWKKKGRFIQELFLFLQPKWKYDKARRAPAAIQLSVSRSSSVSNKAVKSPVEETQHRSLSVWSSLHPQRNTSSWRTHCLSKHSHSYRQTSLISPCARYLNKPHGNILLLWVAYQQNVPLSGEGRTPYPSVTAYGALDHQSSWRISPECLGSDCSLCWRRQQRLFRVSGMLRRGILWCCVLRLSSHGNVNQSRHKFRKNDGYQCIIKFKDHHFIVRPCRLRHRERWIPACKMFQLNLC